MFFKLHGFLVSYRMVHDGDWDFKQKVQKLVSAGLLEFQV